MHYLYNGGLMITVEHREENVVPSDIHWQNLSVDKDVYIGHALNIQLYILHLNVVYK